MGLYTPNILGENSYLSWFYCRAAKNDPAHTGTSKGLSQAIHRGPIRKFLPKYANIYVRIQSHGLSAGARSHYATANGVRNGLPYIIMCKQYPYTLFTPALIKKLVPEFTAPSAPSVRYSAEVIVSHRASLCWIML